MTGIIWPGSSIAQTQSNGSNLKMQTIFYSEAAVVVDSVSIIPVSLLYDSKTDLLGSDLVTFEHNALIFKPGFASQYDISKPLILRYRRLPVNFAKTFRRIDTTLIQRKGDINYIGFAYEQETNAAGLADFRGIDYSGSFSRGLSFGNRQNLVLNSSLNLQLAGTVGSDIQILAAISDNTIPIQPEGNTQQLQEFDRIFIQISKDEHTIRAGDFEIGRPDSYFLNYFKRSQGVMYSNVTKLAPGKMLNSSGSFAISKGKFRRQFIQQIEGNQGPYKLTGNDNELFIIVLANTEKVFLDGALMNRGLENDYVIDYNRGEVIFTAKRLITKDARIIVEFEYTDQNYLRSMYTVSSTYEDERWKLDFNVFSEQDNKNSPGNQFLTDEDKLLLAQMGDNLEGAFVNSFRPVNEENPSINAITYSLRDTTLDNGLTYQNILVFDTNADNALFTAGFTDLGEGMGNYIIGNNLANGRVYEWVAPDPVTGAPRGRFDPKQRIVTPKKQQMVTMGSRYKISKTGTVRAELGISTLDRNTFSREDSGDDNGISAFVEYKDRIQRDTSSKWSFEPSLVYEFKGRNFTPVNPYRPAEFQRDWNIDPLVLTDEHYFAAGMNAKHKTRGSVMYQIGGFIQQENYQGIIHRYDLSTTYKGLAVKFYGSELSAKGAQQETRFSRPMIDINQLLHQKSGLKIGFYGERERNETRATNSDLLSPQSFSWDIARFYLLNQQTRKFRYQLSYTYREDWLPSLDVFKTVTRANEFRAEGAWQTSPKSSLLWNLTTRNMEVPDTSFSSFRPQQTYLGRLTYQFVALKNALRSNTSYEVGSGQEPRLEFTYVEVRQGEGQYIWNDLNGDGIQQLDEFEIAPFQDQANFLRIATLTSDFVRTNNILLNQQLVLDAKPLWFNEKGLKRFLSKWSWQSNLNLTRKAGVEADISRWNPFELGFDIPEIIAISSVARNSIFFNRADPVYEVQLNLTSLRSRNLLTTGFESRRNTEQNFNIRWNPGKGVSILSKALQGLKINDSEAFQNRSYLIHFQGLELETTIQPGQLIRGIGRLKYRGQQNRLGDMNEQSDQYEIQTEMTINEGNRFSLRAGLTYSYITFNGVANSPLEFAMLEGLKDGNNLLWNIQFERRMYNNVQLVVSYEGRKTGELAVVHLARMQLRATF